MSLSRRRPTFVVGDCLLYQRPEPSHTYNRGQREILGLPKRLLPVPDVASHLVCSVCGARNDDLKRPIHARPDARVPG